MNTIKSRYLDRISVDFQLLSEIVFRQLIITQELLENNKNEALFEEIEKNEILIDSLDVKMRDEVINAIFLFSPKAIDLRKIIAYHDMTIYMERIGDQILNVVHFLKKSELDIDDFLWFKKKLMKMLKHAQEMVRNSVFAFSCEDNSRAYLTISTDDKIDTLFHEITAKLHESFIDKPLNSQELLNITSINSISYNIERIGDNATNIAEAAIYLMEGKDIRHGNNQNPAE